LTAVLWATAAKSQTPSYHKNNNEYHHPLHK
jgi:hypothetical protein